MTLNFQPTCSNHPGKTVAFALSLLCFLLANYPLYPQNRKIDSLLTKIQNLPDNEDKTFTLIRLAIAYKHARDSTGLSYARKALQLARKLSLEKSMGDALSQIGSFAKQAHRYPEALQLFDSALYYYKRTQSIGSQADVFNQKGIIFIDRNKFDTAREYFSRALAFYEQIGDSMNIGYMFSNLGITYERQGFYSAALENYFKCLAIDEQMGYDAGIASDYMSIALIFKRQGDLERAIDYYEKSLEISDKTGDDFSTASTLTNLGVVYKDLGELDRALQMQERALEIFKKLKHTRGMIVSIHNIGVVYFKKGNFEKAMNHLQSAIEKSIPLHDDQLNLTHELLIARIYLAQNFYDKALESAKKAWEASVRIEVLDEQKEATFLLSDIYEKMGQTSLALEMTKKGILLKDSIFNVEKSRQIGELQTRYETTQKENQIELLSKESALQESELKRKSLLQNVSLGGIGIIVLAGFVGFRMYRSRKEQQRLLLDQQLKNEKLEAGRLQELDELKSRFFANIAHEFRTPLTLILGPAEQIAENKKATPEIKESNNLIRRSASKLLNLVNQLLDLSKLEDGKIQLNKQNTDFVSFMTGVTMSFESLASEKDIDLNFESNMDSLEMAVDPDRTDKIFYNLISNAFKFTNAGGAISVSLQKKSSENGHSALIEIKVKDSGIGIPKDQLPMIFDRFYRVNDPLGKYTEGTGIGLALSKELVDLHNGSITVESEMGKGSVFTVCLPVEVSDGSVKVLLKNATNMDKERPEHLTVEEEKSQQENIVLLIENNDDVRSFIKGCLSDEYKILEAKNGREGVEMAVEHVPDLIVTDVMMPEMDGYQVSGALKKNQLTSHIPIIMLTAKAGLDSRLEGLETGADDYLEKPFNRKELLIRIKNLIQVRQLLREKFAGQYKETSVPEKELPPQENRFITSLRKILDMHLDDGSFGIDELCRETGVSRTQLHRKIKALTDLSTSRFVRIHKLQKAIELLKTGQYNVSEVSYLTGFSSPSYFTQCFHEELGYAPSDLIDM